MCFHVLATGEDLHNIPHYILPNEATSLLLQQNLFCTFFRLCSGFSGKFLVFFCVFGHRGGPAQDAVAEEPQQRGVAGKKNGVHPQHSSDEHGGLPAGPGGSTPL